METEQRKDGFDIAKAIAIWMVVIGHLYSNIQNDTINIIQFSHMPIFFFISGYFLWTSTQKYSLPVLCLKKVKNLLVPYFAWSMVSFAANLLMMFIKKYGGGYIKEFMGIFIYSRSVWFLLELFLSSVLFAVLESVIRKYKINRYITWIAAWLVFSVILPDELFALYKFKWLFPFLLAGAFYAEKYEVFKEKYKAEIVSLILFLVLSNILYDNGLFKEYATFSYHSWRSIFIGVLYYGVSLSGIIGVFALTHWKKPKAIRNLVCAVGQSSMDIYVIHMLLIKFIFWSPSFSNMYLLYLYVVVYSIGIILLILLLRYKVLKCRIYDILMGRF